MRYTKFFIMFILTALILVSGETSAQSGGINLGLAFPRGEFYQFVKRGGFGGSIEGLIYPYGDRTPFGVGLNLGFYNYGNETRNAPLSYTIPDVTVNVDRTNNIMNFHLLFRLQTNNTLIRPYVDLLFGGSYFFTETTVRKEKNDEEVTSSNNVEDYAWSYGAGAGLLFKLTDMDNGATGTSSPLFLDFKVRYLMGSEAEYLREGDVQVNTTNGQVTYFFSKSKTDLLTVHLGVHAYFTSNGM